MTIAYMLLVLQVLIVGMLLRTMAHQRTAVRVAREAVHVAATAATNADEAARVGRSILGRLETTSVRTDDTASRIERAVTADDIEETQ